MDIEEKTQDENLSPFVCMNSKKDHDFMLQPPKIHAQPSISFWKNFRF